MGAARTIAVVCGALSSLMSGCGADDGPSAASGARAEALPAGAIVVFDEALRSGWADESWYTPVSYANASPVAAGTRSIAVTYGPWDSWLVRRTGSSLAGATTLTLWVNGGRNTGLTLAVVGQKGSSRLNRVDLAQYCEARRIPTNAWTRCQVPVSLLAPAGTVIDGFRVQERNGIQRTPVYFDDVGFLGAAPPPPTVTVSVAPASAALDACAKLRFTATVSGTTNGSITWSVQEGAAGGTIDTAGNYTAPTTPGTYHVIARSTASSTAAATATVIVTERVLSVAVAPTSASTSAGGKVQLAAMVTTTCGTFPAQ